MGTVTQPWRPRPYDGRLGAGRGQGVVGRLGQLDGDRRLLAGAEEDEDLLADLGDDVALPRHVGEGAGQAEGERFEVVEHGTAIAPMLARAGAVTPAARPALTSRRHDRRHDRRKDTTMNRRHGSGWRRRRRPRRRGAAGRTVRAIAQEDDDDTRAPTETERDRGPATGSARRSTASSPTARSPRRRPTPSMRRSTPPGRSAARRGGRSAWPGGRSAVGRRRARGRGRGHRHRGGRPARRPARRQTIAEVAEANGVDVQVVIDAMVAEGQERIDDGRGRSPRRRRGRRARSAEPHRADHRRSSTKASRRHPHRAERGPRVRPTTPPTTTTG